VLVWLTYLPHWPLTEDKGATLAVFCTGPAARPTSASLLSEAIATAALVIGLLSVLTPKNLVPNSGFETAFAPLLVGVIVFAIGLSLGGSTGYVINPARHLGPRLAHALLLISGKGTSDWATRGCRSSARSSAASSAPGSTSRSGPPEIARMNCILALDQGTSSSRAVVAIPSLVERT
jgi:hypothetical protein